MSGKDGSPAPGAPGEYRGAPGAASAAGLTFNGMMLMLNRAFFSLPSNWIPTLVALGNLAVNAAPDGAL